MTSNWRIFERDSVPHDGISKLPAAPPWRPSGGGVERERAIPVTGDEPWAETSERARQFRADERMVQMVNAALYLRRPLLVTGKPGTGKSSLAYAVAHQLKLGRVLRWPVTSRTSLQQGLYHYDAIGRLQELQLEER